MNKQLYYSILQYKHSPILGEAINVGILFFFPEEQTKLFFQMADSTRLRPIYNDFDTKYFNSILKIIQKNVRNFADQLFAKADLINNFEDYIHSYLLKDDDTVLQFTNIFSVLNIFPNIEKAVDEYTKLLLPLSIKQDSSNFKRDDRLIINKVKTVLSSHCKTYSERVEKDIIVNIGIYPIKFDIGWKNGTRNLIHPISFDLQESLSIQKKTAEYCGYLKWLESYTDKNNDRIDLLLGEPQDVKLKKDYLQAIDLLNETSTRKKIVPFAEIDQYAEEVARYVCWFRFGFRDQLICSTTLFYTSFHYHMDRNRFCQ